MNDDWRLRVDVHEEGIAHTLAERLAATELQHDLESTFADSVIVSIEGAQLFCYSNSRDQAERARALISSHARERGWEVDFELRRWHPVAEQWEDPDEPLPQDEQARAAEHERVIESEREESRRLGYPAYEVRVQCPGQGQAVALSEQLSAEGLPSVRRWNFLLIGAADEDSAAQLADRIRGLAPADTTVTAEASLRAIADEQPTNPFSVFGGLAG